MPELIKKSQMKIVEGILKNPGINLRELIEKTKLSPNYVSKYVNYLIEKRIIKEERLEKKRVYLRRFFINFDSSLTRSLVYLIEDSKKEEFFREYPKLKPVLLGIEEEINEIEFFIIYGSYARFAPEKDSDIDILIVGNIKNKERIRESLVSLDIETSIKIESLKQFKERINDSLHQQIITDNILIYDSGKFFDFMKNTRERFILEPKIRPEYLERLKKIEKGKYASYSSIKELRRKIEKR